MLGTVSDLVADNLELGDPPARVRHARMTLDVRRHTAADVARETVASHNVKQSLHISVALRSEVNLMSLTARVFLQRSVILIALLHCLFSTFHPSYNNLLILF